MCSFVAGKGPSPDRLDALVWALTELIVAAPLPKEEPRVRLL
jgi:phage terminase large subunit-like protein